MGARTSSCGRSPSIDAAATSPASAVGCEPGRPRWILVSYALGGAAIFASDLLLPLGVAAGVPYAGLVLVSLWSPRSRDPVYLGIACSLLVLVGYVLSPSGGVVGIVLTNRALALFAICVTTAVCHQRKQAEERFRTVVESAPNAILMVDARGIITLVNGQTESLFGYHRDELIGRPVDILVPPAARDVHPGYLRAFFENPRARAMGLDRDLSACRKDGTEFPVEIGLNPIRTSGKIHVLSAVIDISARKRAEELLNDLNRELREQADKLERSNAELEQFAFVASHDLQEPLRAVQGYCRILADRYAGKLDADADRYLAQVVEGVERMKTLVGELLDYSRLDREDRRCDDVDASELVQDVLLNLEAAIEESDGRVIVGDLPRIRVDKLRFGQLMQNLIGNALKFRGADRPSVAVEATRVGDPAGGGPGRTDLPAGWLIAVKDNGIGIDPKYQEQVFDIFRRLHTRTNYPGTGIGLAICRKIVESRGGRIWVESEPGRGSTFRFSIPDQGGSGHEAN